MTMSASSWNMLLIPVIVLIVGMVVHSPRQPNPLFALVLDGRLSELDLRAANSSLGSVRDEFGNSLLHWAAKAGQIAVCRYLLERGLDPAARNKAGTSVLHWAVYSPDNGSEIIRMLIEAGVNSNTVNDSGETALHWAVDWDRPRSVEVLLRYGADPNAADQHQDTPLHRIPRQCTETSSCASTLKLLLKHGANAVQVNMYGRQALSHIDWDYDAATPQQA